MNRIEQVFRSKQAFVGYLVGGDGGLDYCVDCALQMIEGGVDILEIGLPFSDPVADGPVIQRGAQRALEGGMTSEGILEIGRRIRQKKETPLILFSYYNPLLKRGAKYLKALKKAGFDAVLVVDLPPCIEEKMNHPHYQALKEAELLPIFLVSPSTSEERLNKIAEQAEGFIYYACRKGTTGVRNELPEDVAEQISRIKNRSTIPVAVGFGIADRNSAQALLGMADGFVVGSAFVRLMEVKASPQQLNLFAQSFLL